jgi:hypothetical protein
MESARGLRYHQRMHYLRSIAAAVLFVLPSVSSAFEFEPVAPLDPRSVDPALLTGIYGAWEIRDHSGRKRCRIELLKDAAIGGYQIEVGRDCARAFPVMEDISAWRLLEGWSIDLVDPLRKTRLRFETPDNRYVAFGDAKDIAGMDQLIKLDDRPQNKD